MWKRVYDTCKTFHSDEAAALSQSSFVTPYLIFTTAIFFVNLQLFCPLPGHTLFISPFLTSQITHTASFSSCLSFSAVFYVCRTSLWLPGGSFPPGILLLNCYGICPSKIFFRLGTERGVSREWQNHWNSWNFANALANSDDIRSLFDYGMRSQTPHGK